LPGCCPADGSDNTERRAPEGARRSVVSDVIATISPAVRACSPSRPACPRRAPRSGRQRSFTDNHGSCPCPPSSRISPYQVGRGCFPSSRCSCCRRRGDADHRGSADPTGDSAGGQLDCIQGVARARHQAACAGSSPAVRVPSIPLVWRCHGAGSSVACGPRPAAGAWEAETTGRGPFRTRPASSTGPYAQNSSVTCWS
jgi:hypothetical protein